MGLEITEKQGGRVVALRASGRLNNGDYAALIPRIEKLIDHYGHVRLLFEMFDFHGWTADAFWADFRFNFSHFNEIERMAVIGESRRQARMTRLWQVLSPAEIRFFNPAHIEEARRWLAEA